MDLLAEAEELRKKLVARREELAKELAAIDAILGGRTVRGPARTGPHKGRGPNPNSASGRIRAELANGPKSAREISAALGISIKNVHVLLSCMYSRGRLVRIARGMYELAPLSREAAE